MSSSEDDAIVVATLLLLQKRAKRRSDMNSISARSSFGSRSRSRSRSKSNEESRPAVHPGPSRSNEVGFHPIPSNSERFAVHPSQRNKEKRIAFRRIGPVNRSRCNNNKARRVACNPIRSRSTTIRPRSHKRKFAVHQLSKEGNAVLAKLYPQLCDDEEKFFNFTQMTRNTFEELLSLVHENIRKVDTNFRKSICPRERLLLTLRFLASGETSKSLHYQFKLGVSTVQKIAYEVCDALWEQLKDRELPKLTKASLYGIAKKFWAKWKYPHCLGSIDGKRIQIKCPRNSGSQYYNSFIVLQSVADADGNFIAVDVGGDGKHSDRGVLKQSSFGRALYGNQLPIPGPDTHLEEDLNLNEPLPYVFIGDTAYPLLKCLMRPYPERGLDDLRRIYNFRHSHALRAIDSAFSAMTAKWAILKDSVQMNPSNATKVVLACCVLHNFVRHREGIQEDLDVGQAPVQTFDRNNRAYDGDQPNLTGRPCLEAIQCRDKFAQLLTSNLSVPGQDTAANVRNPAPTATGTTLSSEVSHDVLNAAATDVHFNSNSTFSLSL